MKDSDGVNFTPTSKESQDPSLLRIKAQKYRAAAAGLAPHLAHIRAAYLAKAAELDAQTANSSSNEPLQSPLAKKLSNLANKISEIAGENHAND